MKKKTLETVTLVGCATVLVILGATLSTLRLESSEEPSQVKSLEQEVKKLNKELGHCTYDANEVEKCIFCRTRRQEPDKEACLTYCYLRGLALTKTTPAGCVCSDGSTSKWSWDECNGLKCEKYGFMGSTTNLP